MRASDRYIGVAEYDSSIAIATTIGEDRADQPDVLEHDREPIEQMDFGNGVQQRAGRAGRQVRRRGGAELAGAGHRLSSQNRPLAGWPPLPSAVTPTAAAAAIAAAAAFVKNLRTTCSRRQAG